MIELTEQQAESLACEPEPPARVVNPVTREEFVLLPVAEYRRLAAADYDDGGLTREELHAQAWEAGRSIGWEDVDEYDTPPRQP